MPFLFITETVGKFDSYKVQLKALSEEKYTFEYELNDDFFKKIDSPEVQKGAVRALVSVKKTANVFELIFNLDGVVHIPCDRCLDNMEQPIAYKGKLYVKFGTDFSQEDDEIVIVPESEGEINLAWFLYEFVVLSIPAKHTHAAGKCNKTMSSKLRKHLVKSDEEDGVDYLNDNDDLGNDEQDTDPRWDKLKDLMDTE